MRSSGQGAKAFAIWGTLGMFLVLPLLFVDWEDPPQYPKLEGAVNVVRYLSAPRQTARSSFLAMYPNGQPSEFVKWMFSTVGKAEWPPMEGGFEAGQAKSIRIPLIPAGILLLPGQPHLNQKGRQLVVSADDKRGVLVLDAYFDPGHPPVFSRELEFKLPK
ncbi:hypothetical protein [Nitrospina watsonii]|uniref:Uncharacterized protein n=1 Tax=Nitrospina watsonii TaxID=1323948 RepID=A0ABM9HEQ9_9BACT|nr:hypothetical protein [Nitrospina watsonii]CAI2718624.1 conserved protein of unknown function [Nitrospina watsonii]